MLARWSITWFGCWIFYFTPGWVWAATPAAADGALSHHRLVVLTNGSILEGGVVVEGQHVRILLPQGDLQVRATQVDFVCDSLGEAYTKRKQSRVGNSAASHLEMARWCLQHELFAEAEGEIDSARSIDPLYPSLDLVTRQLQQSRALARRSPQAIADSTAIHVGSGFEIPPPQLELTTEIPQWARVEFVKRIQPMLIHSCATSGCHSPGAAQGMQLDRSALVGVGIPELIQRNLAFVLAEVDFVEPESSSLLRRGVIAHGADEQRSEALSPRQTAILQAWLNQLGIDDDADEAPTVDEAAPADTEGPVDVLPESNSRLQHGVKLRRLVGKDPFDPAVFNRKYTHVEQPEPTALPSPGNSQAETVVPAPQTTARQYLPRELQ